MNRIVKYGLLGTAVVAAAVAATAGYLAATFNPNDYKPQIIKAVKDSTQRSLKLGGNIKLTFFPSIGASLGKVSLSEYKSEQEFASVNSAHVSLALLPLLSKHIVVDEIAIDGLETTLVKHGDGTTNIDDLLGKPSSRQEEGKSSAKSQVSLAIASISVTNASLGYRDERTGAKYDIRNLDIRTGRIVPGKPGEIEISCHVKANQPKLDIDTAIKTTLTLDLEQQHYQLQGLELGAGGTALDINNLKFKVSGDIAARLDTQEFSASKFDLRTTGIKGKDNFDLALNAASVSLAKDKLDGKKLALNTKLVGSTGNIVAALEVPDLGGSLNSIKINSLSLDMKANLPDPKLDMAAQLKTALTVDPENQSAQLGGMTLQAGGSALDMSELKIIASGNAMANLKTREFGTQKFSLKASGKKAGNNFDVTLDAPRLGFANNIFSGDRLSLDARLDGSFGNAIAELSMPGIEGNAQSFRISELALGLDLKQPEQAFKIKLSSPVAGSIKQQQIKLSNLVIAVGATGDKLPGKSVSSELKGSVEADALKQVVQVNLAGGLLQSKVKANVGVKGFDIPAINFDLDVDQFDADQYLPKSKATNTQKSVEPEQPFDLTALRKLELDGNLRIGALKVANIRTSQLHIGVKAHKGKMSINPLSVNLYQGSAKLNATVNAAPVKPAFAVSGTLSSVEIGSLARDAADLDVVEGRGNVNLNLVTQGDLVSSLKKGLNGNMEVNLANGAIKGINLTKLIQNASSLAKDGGTQNMGMNKDEKTEFSEFRASFQIKNGVAHNDDLSIRSQLLSVTGSGDINIGNDSLDYTTKATLQKNQGGGSLLLPVELSGPYADLKYRVDFGAMLADLAKQKLEARKEELKSRAKEEAKTKAEDALKQGLKNLFK